MASKMTKRGIQDNIVTYEHICDTTADLQNIDPKFITLGSVAVVLEGDSGMEFYMANSNKEWLIMTTSTSGGGGGGSFAPEIINPQDGDILVYHASEGKWVNGSGGGGGAVIYEFIGSNIVHQGGTYACVRSVEPASDMAADFIAGKTVIFHIPQAAAGTSIQEQYVPLIAYGKPNTTEGNESSEFFEVPQMSASHSLTGLCMPAVVDESDGTLVFEFYD